MSEESELEAAWQALLDRSRISPGLRSKPNLVVMRVNREDIAGVLAVARLHREAAFPASALMQTRSRTVEMPSSLSLPLAFGMNTRLIGSGR